MPDKQLPRRYRDGNFLYKAETLDELCEQLKIPAATAKAAITRFNEYAVKGEDPDFNRGWSAQDRYYGDPNVKPNCSLGPIETGPFYAVQIYPGDLGTKGGLVTDERSRVLREDGQVIPGLYAAGNSAESVMGRTYPGAGGTIGPALTFGFLAAEDAATEPSRPERAGSRRMSRRDWRLFGRLHARLYKQLGRPLRRQRRPRPQSSAPHDHRSKNWQSGRPPSSTCPTATTSSSTLPTAAKNPRPPGGSTSKQTPRQRSNSARPAAQSKPAPSPPRVRTDLAQAEAYNPHWRNYAKTISRPLVILEGVDV